MGSGCLDADISTSIHVYTVLSDKKEGRTKKKCLTSETACGLPLQHQDGAGDASKRRFRFASPPLINFHVVLYKNFVLASYASGIAARFVVFLVAIVRKKVRVISLSIKMAESNGGLSDV